MAANAAGGVQGGAGRVRRGNRSLDMNPACCGGSRHYEALPKPSIITMVVASMLDQLFPPPVAGAPKEFAYVLLTLFYAVVVHVSGGGGAAL